MPAARFRRERFYGSPKMIREHLYGHRSGALIRLRRRCLRARSRRPKSTQIKPRRQSRGERSREDLKKSCLAAGAWPRAVAGPGPLSEACSKITLPLVGQVFCTDRMVLGISIGYRLQRPGLTSGPHLSTNSTGEIIDGFNHHIHECQGQGRTGGLATR